MRCGLFPLFALFTLTLSICVFPSIAVAEDEWKIYKLDYEGKMFKIPYKIIHGNLTSMGIFSGGTSVIASISMDPVNDGVMFIRLPRNLLDRYAEGTFRVYVDRLEVEYEEVNSSPCFRVLAIELKPDAKEIRISNDYGGFVTENIPPPQTVVAPVYIIADRSSYEVEDVITVSGCTDLSLDEGEVTLEILSPIGEVYGTKAIVPGMNGSFSASFKVSGDHVINGTYLAKATYAGKSVTTAFIVPEFPQFVGITLALALFLVFCKRHQELN